MALWLEVVIAQAQGPESTSAESHDPVHNMDVCHPSTPVGR